MCNDYEQHILWAEFCKMAQAPVGFRRQADSFGGEKCANEVPRCNRPVDLLAVLIGNDQTYASLTATTPDESQAQRRGEGTMRQDFAARCRDGTSRRAA